MLTSRFAAAVVLSAIITAGVPAACASVAAPGRDAIGVDLALLARQQCVGEPLYVQYGLRNRTNEQKQMWQEAPERGAARDDLLHLGWLQIQIMAPDGTALRSIKEPPRFTSMKFGVFVDGTEMTRIGAGGVLAGRLLLTRHFRIAVPGRYIVVVRVRLGHGPPERDPDGELTVEREFALTVTPRDLVRLRSIAARLRHDVENGTDARAALEALAFLPDEAALRS